MKRIHILGRKNHGKTQLVVELVEELTGRGLSVGTIKHTHHQHQLDTPGKDSHRHQQAGATVAGILTPDACAVFIPQRSLPEGSDRYAVLNASFVGCDLVVVEGDTQATAPKIEVWRAEQGGEPMAAADRSILAVATDDPLEIDTLVIPRAQLPQLADWIVKTALA